MKSMSVRLPKINIVQFDGSYMDWPRFWGQFTETVDKSNIAAINKFTYLCGFLGPKVKRRVESLPFTAEGYNRAKSILQDQYGKTPEIVKAYIKEIMDLRSCSLTRGVYLEVLKSLETTPFLRSLKRLIARRGRPSLIYSDNAKTFQAAASWLNKVMKDEKFHSELSKYEIKWRFNLSRAPWWGGQFERLIGIFKCAFYKVIGKGLLTFEELSEVVLDVEICMNNRPLNYLEDDIEFPILTPNSFVLQQSNVVPELECYHIEDGDLRKRARYLQSVKNHLWRRWQREYLTSLRQRHLQTNIKSTTVGPNEGDIVLIKGDEKNRNKWKMGKVTKLIRGKDNVVRGVKLQCAKSTIERPIQLIYPLELECDVGKCETKLNTNAKEFKPRR